MSLIALFSTEVFSKLTYHGKNRIPLAIMGSWIWKAEGSGKAENVGQGMETGKKRNLNFTRIAVSPLGMLISMVYRTRKVTGLLRASTVHGICFSLLISP